MTEAESYEYDLCDKHEWAGIGICPQCTAEDDARYDRPPCMECGAETQQEAEKLCNCGGNKDDCHGCHLWL